jgi:NodT family efflux transporter outer membrane factor (OMF) lipoprotein
VLVGVPPSTFSIAPLPLDGMPPIIPVALPARLLERRPDIAATARRVAAANAEIGVAAAAYYPSVTLSTSGGFQTSQFADWLMWPSRFWSVGPAISQTVYDGGLLKAQSESARAAYDETVASYRNSVLTAIQEVEDNLAALRLLEEEARVQAVAVDAARDSVALTTNQYKGGTVSYLAVVVAQTLALSNERTAVGILNRRMLASVRLIKALGGGWNDAQLAQE